MLFRRPACCLAYNACSSLISNLQAFLYLFFLIYMKVTVECCSGLNAGSQKDNVGILTPGSCHVTFGKRAS